MPRGHPIAGSHPTSTVTPAREVVMARLADRARRFPDLGPEPFEPDLHDPRDRALARAIDQAVSRRWLTLTAVLETRLERPFSDLDPRVAAALLAGAAQLLLLDRLPDHAVIHEAVAWTRGAGPRLARSAGLVNAVLRRVAELRCGEGPTTQGAPGAWPRDVLPLEDGRSRLLRESVFAEDPLARLAEQTSCPPGLLQRWTELFGAQRTAALAAHGLVVPPIIVTGVGTGDVVAGATLRPHEEPGFAIFEGVWADLERLLSERPELRVQDPASAAPVAATGGLMPDLIVDLCAGRGTKTRQAAQLHPQARVIATDESPQRVDCLRQTFEGHDQVLVIEPGALLEWAGRADLVIVDPPCSNTAVLARRVEARYRATPATLEKLVDLQRRILVEALRTLGDHGHLLLATCSLEPQENEQQVAWLERWHRLRARRRVTTWPAGWPGGPASAYHDGAFFALMERGGR